MAWFRVDDKLWGHPKWLAASPAARGLWVTAGSWCSDHLTDGKIPSHVLGTLGGRTKDARELVDLTLWDATDAGWEFGDWLEYQPSKEHVEAEREAARQRQAKAREAAKLRRESQQNNGGSHAVTSAELPEESRSPRPDPTRPDPTVVPTELPEQQSSPTVKASSPAKPKAKRTRIPDDFTVTAEMIAWARNQCPNITQPMLDLSTRKFVEHFENATRNASKVNWLQTWRNWIEGDYQRNPPLPRINGFHSAAPTSRSTTDTRVSEGLDVMNRLREREQSQTRMEIAQ